MSDEEIVKQDILGSFRKLLHGILRDTSQSWIDLQLTLPQLRVFFTVAHNEMLSVKDVSGKLGIGEPTTSFLIDKLVRTGLVDRVENPSDRRRVILRISEDGEKLISDLLGWENYLDRRLGTISFKHLSDLRDGLEEILKNDKE